MTIKQLLEMPIDKEKSKCGGFQLTIKFARKKVKRADGKQLQETIFLDTSGEMPGELLLTTKHSGPVISGSIINVVVCWLQPGEKGPKLFVEQWFYPKSDSEGYPTYRNGVRGYGDLPPDFCSEREGEPVVRSMIRHGIVDAHRSKVGLDKKLTDEQKEIALDDEEFIYTGQ